MKTLRISQKFAPLKDKILVSGLLIIFSPFIAILVLFLGCYPRINSFFNYLLIKFFQCGRFSKELSAANYAKVPELFASICRPELVSGQVTVSSGHRLDCGCSERFDGDRTLSVNRAQEHLSKIVSEREVRYSDSKFDNFTFKTKNGLCTITYPVHEYVVSQEHGSAYYSVRSNAFTLHYLGSKSEFETLVKTAQESAKKGGSHEEIS